MPGAKNASSSKIKGKALAMSSVATAGKDIPLHLIFGWTQTKRMVLMSVIVRSPSTSPARQVLTQIESDTDGSFTIDLGAHPAGQTIAVGFDFRALDAMSKAATHISRNGGPAEKLEPKGADNKKLKKGEAWIVNGTNFKV